MLNHDYTPMLPVSQKCSEFLLKNGHAATYRHYPAVIILKKQQADNRSPERYTVELKIDPGARHSGLALVAHDKVTNQYTALWGANLTHKGNIVSARLESRLSIRRGRRNRQTRYRPSRQANRANARTEGRLMPSSRSILGNIITWARRLQRYTPIHSIAYEWVKFDTQKMDNPEISGVEYQRGELEGYELREYLLEKYKRKCVYCEVDNKPLQIEHIIPRSKGGSDRASNLAIACEKCNQKKGNKPIEEFLSHDPERLKKVKGQLKKGLQPAAAVQTIRNATHKLLCESTGLPVSLWSGGRTKMNRVKQGYLKDHWIDAICVGETGERVTMPPDMQPLLIRAMGRGNRHFQETDSYGFPRVKKVAIDGKEVMVRCNAKEKRKRVGSNGVQTGDMVLFRHKTGLEFKSRVISIDPKSKSGGVTARHPTTGKKISARAAACKILQKTDGYGYNNTKETEEA